MSQPELCLHPSPLLCIVGTLAVLGRSLAEGAGPPFTVHLYAPSPVTSTLEPSWVFSSVPPHSAAGGSAGIYWPVSEARWEEKCMLKFPGVQPDSAGAGRAGVPQVLGPVPTHRVTGWWDSPSSWVVPGQVGGSGLIVSCLLGPLLLSPFCGRRFKASPAEPGLPPSSPLSHLSLPSWAVGPGSGLEIWCHTAVPGLLSPGASEPSPLGVGAPYGVGSRPSALVSPAVLPILPEHPWKPVSWGRVPALTSTLR